MGRLRIYDQLKAQHDRPVNVLDYNEYRKLEEKRDRIVLKIVRKPAVAAYFLQY